MFLNHGPDLHSRLIRPSVVTPAPMIRVAVLIKQVPSISDLRLNPDGTLDRESAGREMNPHCRRALSKGLGIAREYGGTTTVFTLGPPAAEEVLHQAIAAGASRAIHISDPLLKGADTYLTARYLSRALAIEGPFDLILMGRNSIDSDTGQVGPQLAEFLGLDFLRGAISLQIRGTSAEVSTEESGPTDTEVRQMPLVISCAERLCDPVRFIDSLPDLDPELLVTHTLDRLGVVSGGAPRSLTTVSKIKEHRTDRLRHRLVGSTSEIAEELTRLLIERGAVATSRAGALPESSMQISAVPEPTATAEGRDTRSIDDSQPNPDVKLKSGDRYLMLVDIEQPNQTGALIGTIGQLADGIDAYVDAIIVGKSDDDLDKLLQNARVCRSIQTIDRHPRTVSEFISTEVDLQQPKAIFAASSVLATEALARVSARHGFGMVADAIGVEIVKDRIVGLKPAFGGTTVAEILCESPTSVFTLRLAPTSRLTTGGQGIADPQQSQSGASGLAALQSAEVVIGVGMGVALADYERLEPLRNVLQAEYAATRKVTDRGHIDRLRQVGVTGTFLLSNLYFAIGISGKLNHTIGLSRVGTVVAINPDPSAPIFENSDFSIVADYRVVLPAIVASIETALISQAPTSDLDTVSLL